MRSYSIFIENATKFFFLFVSVVVHDFAFGGENIVLLGLFSMNEIALAGTKNIMLNCGELKQSVFEVGRVGGGQGGRGGMGYSLVLFFVKWSCAFAIGVFGASEEFVASVLPCFAVRSFIGEEQRVHEGKSKREKMRTRKTL